MLLIIVLTVAAFVKAQKLVYYSSGSIPTYTYPIPMKVGDNLNVTLFWKSTTTNLTALLFQRGDDLLSKSDLTSQMCQSCQKNTSTLIFTASREKQYFVSVGKQQDSQEAKIQFQINIYRNSILLRNQTDTYIKQKQGTFLFQVGITRIGQFNFNYTGPRGTNINFYPPGSNVATQSPLFSFPSGATAGNLNFPSVGNWIAEIYHGVTSSIFLIKYLFTICDSYLRFTEQSMSCECPSDKYAYNPTTKLCQINCDKIINTGGVSPDSADLCLCKYELIFNPFKLQCECDTKSTAFNRCICDNHFYFDADILKCRINCTNITFSSSPISGSINECLCQDKHYFNTTVAECILNCSLISNSTTLAPDAYYTCLCVQMFYFDKSINRCLVNCSLIDYSQGRQADYRCFCDVGYQWNDTSVKCDTVCGDNYVTPSQQCDDGNTNDNDGCSSECKKQITSIVAGAVGAGLIVVSATIATLGVVFSAVGASSAGVVAGTGIGVATAASVATGSGFCSNLCSCFRKNQPLDQKQMQQEKKLEVI